MKELDFSQQQGLDVWMRAWCYIGGFFVSDENFQKIYCPLGQSITNDNEFD